MTAFFFSFNLIPIAGSNGIVGISDSNIFNYNILIKNLNAKKCFNKNLNKKRNHSDDFKVTF